MSRVKSAGNLALARGRKHATGTKHHKLSVSVRGFISGAPSVGEWRHIGGFINRVDKGIWSPLLRYSRANARFVCLMKG